MDGERRLDSLEQHSARTEQRLGTLEERQIQHGAVLRDHGGKLDTILTAVTRAEAAPKFDWLRTLQAVALIIGMVMGMGVPMAGFGVWFVTILGAKDNEVQNIKISYSERIANDHAERLKALEKSLSGLYAAPGWKAVIEGRQ